ncbi:MAG: CARDB domain-containing protein [Candidatus Hydrogenedentota bacterium]
MNKIISCLCVLALAAAVPVAAQNQQPDLAVSSSFKLDVVTQKTGEFTREQVVHVTGTVRNNGDVTASSVPISLYAKGELIGTSMVPELPSAFDHKFTFAWKPTAAARYELRAIVDPSGSLAEASEANNVSFLTLNINSRRVIEIEAGTAELLFLTKPSRFDDQTMLMQSGDIDLEFDRDPYLTGATPRARRSGSIINLDISNHGTMSAKNVEVAVYMNGQRQIIRTIGTIPAGKTRHVHLNWRPQIAGDQTLSVVVDPRNKIGETAEINNSVSIDVSIGSAPTR